MKRFGSTLFVHTNKVHLTRAIPVLRYVRGTMFVRLNRRLFWLHFTRAAALGCQPGGPARFTR